MCISILRRSSTSYPSRIAAARSDTAAPLDDPTRRPEATNTTQENGGATASGGAAVHCGGGGNRTRVLRRLNRASPGAAHCVSTRPHRSREQAGVTGPATVRCPPVPRWPGAGVSPLNDAGFRVGDIPGPTELGSSLRRRERARADWCRRLYGCDAWFSRSSSPSSARFPCLDVRSRDLSPPRCVRPV